MRIFCLTAFLLVAPMSVKADMTWICEPEVQLNIGASNQEYLDPSGLKRIVGPGKKFAMKLNASHLKFRDQPYPLNDEYPVSKTNYGEGKWHRLDGHFVLNHFETRGGWYISHIFHMQGKSLITHVQEGWNVEWERRTFIMEAECKMVPDF